jgi:hypothetical protein
MKLVFNCCVVTLCTEFHLTRYLGNAYVSVFIYLFINTKPNYYWMLPTEGPTPFCYLPFISLPLMLVKRDDHR